MASEKKTGELISDSKKKRSPASTKSAPRKAKKTVKVVQKKAFENKELSSSVSEENNEVFMIFNCMHKDMYAWVGEGKKRILVQIPKAPSPELLYAPDSPTPKTILVPNKENMKKHNLGKMTEYAEVKTIGVLQEPKELPNTIYLVEAEDILQFPERTDFYTPATYELVRRSDEKKFLKTEHAEEKKKNKKKKKDKETEYLFDLNVVASITRIPYGEKKEDSPVFDDEYFVEVVKRSDEKYF
jgi:hypothetical protein